ncbi:MFS transporter [Clostridiales bacterium COT073_COT-073]|nr:MFS transporter [Clostridiales bacterium COT073_COT-073]
MAKELGKDKFGVQRTMRRRDFLGDSLGQFALNAMSGLIGQATYFYTDKVGVAAGAVAMVLLICKIVDAFTDLIMGNIVDHTKPGKEKYRPWLLKAGIPAGILTGLMFTVPKGSAGLQLTYLMITNLLFTAVAYTAVCIPYASLMIVRTNSQEERGRMGTWRAASGYVSGMIMAVAIIPVTNMLGGTQSAWIKFGAIAGALVILAFLLCYKTSKEVILDETAIKGKDVEEAVPFKEALTKLFQNKYWVMILIMNFISSVLYAITGSSGAFYAKWIYGNDNLMGIMGAIGLIPTLIGFIIVGPMVKHLGVTKTLRVSFAVGAVCTIVRIVNPYSFAFNVGMGSFSTLANIPMMCLMGVMTAMSIDYNEYKYGKKMVASSQAASSFGGKVGGGIGGSVIGWCLALAAYDPMMTAATAATKQAIFSFSIYIPAAMFAAMFIISMKFDLEKKLPQLREEIAKRKVQQEA